MAETIVEDVDLHGKSQERFLSILNIKSCASLKKRDLFSFLDSLHVVMNYISFYLAARKFRAKSGSSSGNIFQGFCVLILSLILLSFDYVAHVYSSTVHMFSHRVLNNF